MTHYKVTNNLTDFTKNALFRRYGMISLSIKNTPVVLDTTRNDSVYESLAITDDY